MIPSARRAWWRRHPWWRRGLLVGMLVVLLGGTWWWAQRRFAVRADPWRVSRVERGAIRVAVSATGTLSAISTVTVGSQISGQVTAVLVDYNDKVRRGQIVARIDPSTYRAQIEQGTAQINAARAALASARATLRNAQLDYTRKAALGTQELVARSTVDLARAARDQARAEVDSTRQQIVQQRAATRTLQLDLGRTVIRSPVDGVVLTRSIEPGQTVAANFSTPELFTIAEDLSKMKIELAVDESDIGQVKPGQPVVFTVDAFPDRQFEGTVQQLRLAATTSNNVVTYPVIVTVDNSDGTLLPGLTVNAEIQVQQKNDVLKVANAALRFHPRIRRGGQVDAGTEQADATEPSEDGLIDDIVRAGISGMQLTRMQRRALETGAELSRRRAEQRRPAAAAGAGGLFGGVPLGQVVFLTGTDDLETQIRQRTIARYQQDFSAFRNALNQAQRRRWDLELADLVGAKRVPLYRLVNHRVRRVMVGVGASDGSSSEIFGGGIAVGDAVVIGERAGE